MAHDCDAQVFVVDVCAQKSNPSLSLVATKLDELNEASVSERKGTLRLIVIGQVIHY